MSFGVFLQPKLVPANTGFPGTPDKLLRFIAQYMCIGGLENLKGVQVQEDKPSNTSLPWLATDAIGKPLGWFLFHNSIWVSVEHEKGDFKYQNLTGAIHPHWKLADNNFNPGPFNGVTIPTVTDRGLKAAATGGKYNVGDTGGTDELNLAHVHDISIIIGNTALTSAQLGTITINVTFVGDSQSGGDSKLQSISFNGTVFGSPGHGGSSQTQSIIMTGAAESHGHQSVLSETTKLSAAQDIRSLYYGARLLIYVGVE